MIHKNGNISGPEGASVFYYPVKKLFSKNGFTHPSNNKSRKNASLVISYNTKFSQFHAISNTVVMLLSFKNLLFFVILAHSGLIIKRILLLLWIIMWVQVVAWLSLELILFK